MGIMLHVGIKFSPDTSKDPHVIVIIFQVFMGFYITVSSALNLKVGLCLYTCPRDT